MNQITHSTAQGRQRHTAVASILAAAAAVVTLSGCVGSAGIGADGTTVAERETSVWQYSRSGQDVDFSAVLAKKVLVEDVTVETGATGEVTLIIGRMESGDRTAEKALDTAASVANLARKVLGDGSLGQKFQADSARKQARQVRLEAQAKERQTVAEARRLEAEQNRLEAERALLLEQERLRREAEAHAAAEGHE